MPRPRPARRAPSPRLLLSYLPLCPPPLRSPRLLAATAALGRETGMRAHRAASTAAACAGAKARNPNRGPGVYCRPPQPGSPQPLRRCPAPARAPARHCQHCQRATPGVAGAPLRRAPPSCHPFVGGCTATHTGGQAASSAKRGARSARSRRGALIAPTPRHSRDTPPEGPRPRPKPLCRRPLRPRANIALTHRTTSPRGPPARGVFVRRRAAPLMPCAAARTASGRGRLASGGQGKPHHPKLTPSAAGARAASRYCRCAAPAGRGIGAGPKPDTPARVFAHAQPCAWRCRGRARTRILGAPLPAAGPACILTTLPLWRGRAAPAMGRVGRPACANRRTAGAQSSQGGALRPPCARNGARRRAPRISYTTRIGAPQPTGGPHSIPMLARAASSCCGGARVPRAAAGARPLLVRRPPAATSLCALQTKPSHHTPAQLVLCPCCHDAIRNSFPLQPRLGCRVGGHEQGCAGSRRLVPCSAALPRGRACDGVSPRAGQQVTEPASCRLPLCGRVFPVRAVSTIINCVHPKSFHVQTSNGSSLAAFQPPPREQNHAEQQPD